MSRQKLDRTYPREVKWLLKHKPVLSFLKIEQKIGLPQSCLYKLSKGEIGLNEVWWPKIVKFVREMNKI